MKLDSKNYKDSKIAESKISKDKKGESSVAKNASVESKLHYLDIILQKSDKYLKQEFSELEYREFLSRIESIYKLESVQKIIKAFEKSLL